MSRTNDSYYISTGAKVGFYTLRHAFDEPVYARTERGTIQTGVVRRDYYIMTLTRDPQTALEKAQAWMAANAPGDRLENLPDFTLDEIRRRAQQDIDYSVFPGGKHAGRPLEWVLENDLEYALWVAENLGHQKAYAGIVSILREVLASELADRATKTEKAREVQRHRWSPEVAEVLKSLAATMEDGRGGFRDAMAQKLWFASSFPQDMAQALPSGRALEITKDILAKQAGRANSNAYEEEYAKLEEFFESLGA